jgi:hypothetical protein
MAGNLAQYGGQFFIVSEYGTAIAVAAEWFAGEEST